MLNSQTKGIWKHRSVSLVNFRTYITVKYTNFYRQSFCQSRHNGTDACCGLLLDFFRNLSIGLKIRTYLKSTMELELNGTFLQCSTFACSINEGPTIMRFVRKNSGVVKHMIQRTRTALSMEKRS